MANIIKQGKQDLNHKKSLSKRKTLIIVAIVAVLFAGGVAVGWFYMMSQQQAVQTTAALLDEEKLDQVLVDAQTLANNGDVEGASAVYDKAVKETNDNYQKSIITLGKSTIYLNNGDYEQALKLALEAESINQNPVVTRVIGQMYEEQGNKQKAIEYYQKTIDLTDMDDPMASDDIDYYKALIKELGGEVK